MKISTSLLHGVRVGGLSYRESAAMMRRAGFEGIDLSMGRYQTEPEKLCTAEWRDDVCAMADAARAEGLGVAQCHLPYFGSHLPAIGDGGYDDFEAFMLPAFRFALETCEAAACPIAVLHPFFVPGDPDATRTGNLRLIEKLLPLLERYDVRLALENIYGSNYSDIYVSRPDFLLDIMDYVNSPLVGACIDTGHANIFRIHIGDMARKYGNRLFALHVHGNSGKDEHTIPYSMSGWCEQMDFRDFSDALREIGYAGWYNLEINPGDMPSSVIGAYYAYAAAMGRALADLVE